MGDFLLFLLIVGFFYLFSRVKSLEKEVQELLVEKGEKKELVEEKISLPEEAKPVFEYEKAEEPEVVAEEKPEIKEEYPAKPKVSFFEKPIKGDFEFEFGSKIATAIGVVAIILAVGFFIRHAIESGWIDERTRIIIGLLGGIILLVVGELTGKSFPTYGQIVTGGGLGVLYLSLYTAFNSYNIVSQAVAFLGMVVVTAVGTFLAVKKNSVALAFFCQLGGFITPYLISTGESNPHLLFIYITFLDVGIFAIAKWKLWRILNFGGFLGTILVFSFWFVRFYSPDQFFIAQGYLSLFFSLFLGISVLQHFEQKEKEDEYNLGLLTLNAALYFAGSYIIINAKYPQWMGLFTALLAGFHLLLAFFAYNTKSKESFSLFQQFLAGIGFVFLVITIPIQFEGFWITLGWAAEALVLVFLGFQMRSMYLRFFANIIFLISSLRLVLVDNVIGKDVGPWTNTPFLTGLVCFLFFSLGAALYWFKKSEIKEEEKKLFSLLLIESSLILVWAVSLQIVRFFPHWWLSVLWPIGALLIALFSFLLRDFPVRVLAMLLLLATIFRIIAFDSSIGRDANAWWNPRVYVLLVTIICVINLIFLFDEFKDRTDYGEYSAASQTLFPLAYFLLIWLVSAEISDFHSLFWLPILWSLIGILGGWVAIFKKNKSLRFVVYLTFIVTFFRLIFFEGKIDFENYISLFNLRTFSFLVTVLSMGGFLYLFQKNKDDFPEDEQSLVPKAIFLVSNFLLIWVLSSEVLDYFNKQYSLLSLEERRAQIERFQNLKNAFLSVAWTFYSVILLIIGIIRKSSPERLLAIFIFGITTAKVFLYDTANLSDFYRFISFITLGVILLSTGYLYYRYRERITQFVKADSNSQRL